MLPEYSLRQQGLGPNIGESLAGDDRGAGPEGAHRAVPAFAGARASLSIGEPRLTGAGGAARGSALPIGVTGLAVLTIGAPAVGAGQVEGASPDVGAGLAGAGVGRADAVDAFQVGGAPHGPITGFADPCAGLYRHPPAQA
ncbi:MAG: hypothetical protein CMM93_04835 [Rickettsiales bacterium]|nr:hypothetical protein [Rickettsiales bacterium]